MMSLEQALEKLEMYYKLEHPNSEESEVYFVIKEEMKELLEMRQALKTLQKFTTSN
jgi:DNA-directed RNA polymerase subunit L